MEGLIDFLSQMSKLYYFNVLDLADFIMQFLVSFFCANTVALLWFEYVYHFELRQ